MHHLTVLLANITNQLNTATLCQEEMLSAGIYKLVLCFGQITSLTQDTQPRNAAAATSASQSS